MRMSVTAVDIEVLSGSDDNDLPPIPKPTKAKRKYRRKEIRVLAGEFIPLNGVQKYVPANHRCRKQWRRTPCEVCGSTINVVLDHCHKHMLVRGWLCSGCNGKVETRWMRGDPLAPPPTKRQIRWLKEYREVGQNYRYYLHHFKCPQCLIDRLKSPIRCEREDARHRYPRRLYPYCDADNRAREQAARAPIKLARPDDKLKQPVPTYIEVYGKQQRVRIKPIPHGATFDGIDYRRDCPYILLGISGSTHRRLPGVRPSTRSGQPIPVAAN